MSDPTKFTWRLILYYQSLWSLLCNFSVIYHFHQVLFHWLSWLSDSAPNGWLHFVLIILSTCYLFRIYTYFWFQVIFLLFLTFHALLFTLPYVWPFVPCALTLFTIPSNDILYFYDLSLLCSWFVPMQYINWCIFLVVLQFVNWCWFHPLLLFLKPLLFHQSLSLLSRHSPCPLVTLFTKTKLWPSDPMSWLLLTYRTPV